MEDWKWFGNPGHLAVAHRCRFHLATAVCNGEYLVSTVGGYFPSGQESAPTEIGCDRLYETMVFVTTGGTCHCGCGMPDIDLGEIDFRPYNTPKDANEGHLAMCNKWEERREENDGQPRN